MKSYRSPRQLLADVQSVLANNKPSFRASPLDDVIGLLCLGRHYSWMGIYLAVRENASQPPVGVGSDGHNQVLPEETRAKILISIRVASRELGVLSVESDRENAFGGEDRVLLEKVANAMARFLSGRGKYLVRRARQTTPAAQLNFVASS